MTIETTSVTTTHPCNGVTVAFDTEFYFEDDTDLVVYIVTTATGAIESTLTYKVDYVVTGRQSPNGGTITLIGSLAASPPLTGKSCRIDRVTPITMETDLRSQTNYDPAVVERGLTKLTQVAQETDAKAEAALTEAEAALAQAALTAGYAAAASASATSAAASASTASTAAASVAGSVAAAATSETNAAASATAAAASATTASGAAASAAALGYATLALLQADLTPGDGQIRWVTNDTQAANNGAYRKSGATGAGSWVKSAIPYIGSEEREEIIKRDKARATSGTGRPWAAVVIGMGQSRNTSRGTRVLQNGWPNAKMFFDAVAISEFDFASANVEHATNWDSVASTVLLQEGTGQSPMIGIANTIGGGKFAAAYICSVAIGSRKVSTLWKHGPRCNLQAAIKRLCEEAWAAGYQPIVMGTWKQGEAEASAAIDENTYYANCKLHFQQFQWYAAVAMGKPDYIAPIVMDMPQQTSGGNSGANDVAVKNGLIRIARDIPGTILVGCASQYPNDTDRVHHTDAGMVMTGERDGRALRAYFEQGQKGAPLRCIDLTISGTTFVATFNQPVIRDATLNTGQSLNTTNAEDGLEWFDNGSAIAITAGSLVYQGWKITGTLASTPVGTPAQQVLRIGSQATSGTASGAANLAGTVIRANTSGWQSPYDYTYTNYDWACPQSVTARAP